MSNQSFGLYLASDREISLLPNNSHSMTLATDGNVGIGTEEPNEKLEVAGIARVDALTFRKVDTFEGSEEGDVRKDSWIGAVTWGNLYTKENPAF